MSRPIHRPNAKLVDGVRRSPFNAKFPYGRRDGSAPARARLAPAGESGGMADALDLGSSTFGCGGSSPPSRTGAAQTGRRRGAIPAGGGPINVAGASRKRPALSDTRLV